jgi:hypothetical protein
MSTLAHLTLSFEGRPLTTITLGGVAGWPAHEIGELLGYAHGGRRLVNAITGEWASEFIENHDYIVITGKELAAVKAAVNGTREAVSPFANKVIMLLEPGLDLVLLKTSKEIGRRLRRFLVDEILPRLRRGESIPAPGTAPDPKPVVETAKRPMIGLTELRELRLWRQADLADRRFRSASVSSIGRWLHSLGRIDTDALVRFEVAAAQIALSRAPAGAMPVGPLPVDIAFVLDTLHAAAA